MSLLKVYVASSWRNDRQPEIVAALLKAGFEVYDFRNPPDGNGGFQWSDIDQEWKHWDNEKYLKALNHDIAEKGFTNDYNGMKEADVCVLVMPCGRSAHLEAGYFAGSATKTLHILLADEPAEPELMYKLANSVNTSIDELINRLHIEQHVKTLNFFCVREVYCESEVLEKEVTTMQHSQRGQPPT